MPPKKKSKARRKMRIPRILGIPVWHYQHLHILGLLVGLAPGFIVSSLLAQNNGRHFMESPERYVPILLGAGLGFLIGEFTRRIIYHRHYDEHGRLKGYGADYDD